MWGGIKIVANFIYEAFKWIIEPIAGAGKWLWEGIKGVAYAIYDAFVWITSPSKNVGKWIWEGIKGVANAIYDAFKWILSGFANAGKWLWDGVKLVAGLISNAFKWILSGFVSAGEWLWGGVKKVGNFIYEAFKWIVSPFEKAGEWLWSGVKAVANKLYDAFKWIASPISDIFEGRGGFWDALEWFMSGGQHKPATGDSGANMTLAESLRMDPNALASWYGLESFQRGGFIPDTGLFYGHRGEGVLSRTGMGLLGMEGLNQLNLGRMPATKNEYHFYIQAWDGDDIERVLTDKVIPMLKEKSEAGVEIIHERGIRV
ncbi:hypothetical protein ES705_49311 [subsurface metagenome]